ncbi:hypothetical protein O9G_002786 [Rozella allomycis CSF55]|uniref:Uncharacterized protein n=1 Tax=Rozella allomycis (strain CSF55) TaxID=988480 RepID=A0A075AMM0_ROZAC|nr:hypothetical protein O9G_002786 [Rozella allomycis CSF55]|eukprot:EPZ30909.1 hypothetical protein O9G_002786 [Rozella allomycis CSF55]
MLQSRPSPDKTTDVMVDDKLRWTLNYFLHLDDDKKKSFTESFDQVNSALTDSAKKKNGKFSFDSVASKADIGIIFFDDAHGKDIPVRFTDQALCFVGGKYFGWDAFYCKIKAIDDIKKDPAGFMGVAVHELAHLFQALNSGSGDFREAIADWHRIDCGFPSEKIEYTIKDALSKKCVDLSYQTGAFFWDFVIKSLNRNILVEYGDRDRSGMGSFESIMKSLTGLDNFDKLCDDYRNHLLKEVGITDGTNNIYPEKYSECKAKGTAPSCTFWPGNTADCDEGWETPGDVKWDKDAMSKGCVVGYRRYCCKRK